MNENTYQELEKEVWLKGICSGCGACVAVCPPGSIYFEPGKSSDNPMHTGYCKSADDGVACGACYNVCPRVKDSLIEENDLLGNYMCIMSAKSQLDIPRRQSGGAVTAMLVNALETGLIDAVVVVAEDPWTLKPYSAVISDSDSVVSKAGSRYNWWVPLVSALNDAVIRQKYRNIAVVGVPCVAQAISRIRESDLDLLMPFRDSIRLMIGLFCTETFDYVKLLEEKLSREHSILPFKVERFDVKGKLEITLDDGNTITFPLSELEDCVRPGCNVCTDFTANYSDISAGSVGSPDGYTTLIIRTEKGKKLLDSAIEKDRLTIIDDCDLAIIEKLSDKKRKRK
ncbi:coenzyme F420 hydrogenase/dehydrogenase beta subunit domain protein [Methanosalsum zhilinae DSM 4017]|uniref:Coenzyme F420 hydrogenase/dehydrogenase beta subunit domain protein n=1 Tax=Methanosalsum zhilinae (strain DSM 4017 / NBRC 107636 / OCM 62 / WeN5) TaxID=679901 RepID=F7XP18_METZD|nr:Coenzyme F420 hydrogenase/dehydrogenase, beta subunit C-terminal domain [Methanosalsum zhilinae]AEH60213.1 coenzyme F420 hydrogenase/dehydrogenase beta subunit domain protein [Methanosalsum zhilinae DSM 4017]